MSLGDEHEKRIGRMADNMSRIKHKIMVMSGKGGVGKTTVSVNLAHELSREYKVGLLDTDITGPNVPKMLGIEGEKLDSAGDTILPTESFGLKVISMAFLLQEKDTPVIWRGPLRGNVIQQFLADVEWGLLDYLIIDLPPGTGDEALTLAQSIPDIDGSIVVTTPQDVALLDARKAINFSKTTGVPVIGIIENMSGLKCPNCQHEIKLFKSGGGEKMAEETNTTFLGRIPIQPEIVEAGDAGEPFTESYVKTEAAESFRKITEKIVQTLKKP